ncbi:putative MPP superfamily phosphohydrolase [Thermolongibacillus altinsuensis]|uniref:Putative MPP superfamily phosphohydrolase n=1 Tax=Thermolongibacillus altinsuensis TaxID=575256 RepID=A0A4R1QJ69_9BACL|nr:metallophosphoesterase [Thermolongibacillus altinsuensis]TCL53137.1 putative MPP superfamily phosphohydrolase [Thermolongibacillus altinsuensis]
MWIFFVVIICFIFYMWMEAHRNRIVRHHFSFSSFPKSFRRFHLFFISDIHRRRVSPKLIERLKGDVDLVVIGGDLTEKGVPFARVKENILLLRQLGPVYFVWGNNDYEVDFHELDALLLDCGVKILDNTAVMFESEEGERVALIGVDDVNGRRDRLDFALSDVPRSVFRILVSHDPRIVQKIKKEDDIHLVLSGHTHGGQIRFWKFGLYEKGGVKEINGMKVLVSNGYGTTALPLRFGAPAEVHLLSLHSEKD